MIFLPNAGWIKTFRKSKEHWLYQEKPFDRYHAWEDILLSVNHEKNKFLHGNKIITVESGQMVTSLRKLGEQWGWSQEKVRRFLNLLVSDGMLKIECDTTKTVISVTKWSFYQSESSSAIHVRDASETETETNKNDKNDKKKRKKDTPQPPEGECPTAKDTQKNRFEEFWATYPKKVGKEAARKSWKRIKPNADLFSRMLSAIEISKHSQEWNRENGRYIPHPTTWLNQGRWDDEVKTNGKNIPSSGKNYDEDF